MSVGLSAGERAAGSRWHRLRHTPLRDVLRGRISGRLDIEAALGGAELPEALAELVRTTARRTRLWRLEKVEVARELAAHFQDGIDAGATPEDLANSFGDARRAARLIRRAKVRNRPAAAKATTLAIRTVLTCFVLVIAVYAGLVIRLHTGSPTLSRNYLAELNAPVLAIPEEDRAWPLYREAFLMFEPFPRHIRLDPAEDRWPELVAYAERHAEAIELLHLAARKPHLGRVHGTLNELEEDSREASGVLLAGGIQLPPEENPCFIEIFTPELSYFRDAAKMLTVDAFVAAGRGQSDRVYRDLETTLMTVEHMSESPFLISDLVALAILSRTADSIGIILRDHAELLGEEQLIQLSHRLAGTRGGGPLRVSFVSERWVFEDLIQRLYTDDGDGSGRLAAEAPELLACMSGGTGREISHAAGNWVLGPVLAGVMVDRREMLRKYDELMSANEAEAQLPLWQRGGSVADREVDRLNASPVERVRYLPVVIMLPSLSRASAMAELATLRRDAALAALACELYRRDHGQWPAALAELSPHYLPSPPVDRFDGEPLRYQFVDGRPLLYSIGRDLDDDGGRVPDSPSDRRSVRDWLPPSAVAALKADNSPDLPDGDWVLWPPGE